jgi:hypothetical protein
MLKIIVYSNGKEIETKECEGLIVGTIDKSVINSSIYIQDVSGENVFRLVSDIYNNIVTYYF